ncbi:MAG: hypothetical protein EU517_00690 [Promethearchaeota archaeon]|nr:MAG: hypothetical protein EU517_00690 [Candidatus Lokiarchaeota archaeon]
MKYLNKLITHKRGDIPLILSVPHGGEVLCDEVPTRSSGIRGIDRNTILLAKELVKMLQHIYDKRSHMSKEPSFVFSDIARSKIDLNRPQERAFNQDSVLAKNLYLLYHHTIKKYILQNIEVYNTSILLDIHGFEVKSRPRGFRDVDIILGTNNLNSLSAEPIKKKDWSNNIRGRIIKKFLGLEIPIAPGHPRRREYVLSGGYITKKYGASQISNSQAIQIEFSDRIRIDQVKLRKLVLKSLAEIFFEYFNQIKSL